ncbi:hypothetical protein BDM02DRAFT_3183796 [Thelephora ganbajun]|uniref:Uncharacterized protein n=1 Tax=Thelephora ganbajun TaxID=370292 RepID=A0ACB6ZSI5_THEGA|nr:hypothetical protein BDM02DRAFT_3183796 [Thelephora ganbajun]
MGLSGGSKDTKPKTIEQVKESVSLNASSKEEEALADSIRQFIADAEESKH